jgi:hypothetical protein
LSVLMPPILKRLPVASPFGQYRRAISLLISAAPGAPEAVLLRELPAAEELDAERAEDVGTGDRIAGAGPLPGTGIRLALRRRWSVLPRRHQSADDRWR